MDNFTNDEVRTEGRGRSAKKRAAKAVEKMAEQLVDLPDAELPNLPLSEELRSELSEVRSIRGHSSRKRSIKHFAGLLRRDDEAREKLQEALVDFEMKHGQETAVHHDLEKLRERLCSPQEHDVAMQEVADRFPEVDRKSLLRLVKAVQHSGDKKAYREIFRRLRDAES